MHHMCTVRKNLAKKYENSNLNLGTLEIRKEIQDIKNDVLKWSFKSNRLAQSKYALFRGKLIEKTENKFNIKLDNF